MIEIKVDCLNPGCKINYKVDELVVNIEETLRTMTDEIIRVMNNRELEHNKKKFKDNLDLGGLTITTSDESSKFTTEL
tara:strand:- start:106 stop:339 length:234 start_codon:yes stop_codon:yes gene_type:complete